MCDFAALHNRLAVFARSDEPSKHDKLQCVLAALPIYMSEDQRLSAEESKAAKKQRALDACAEHHRALR
jgi:hypothetical protein